MWNSRLLYSNLQTDPSSTKSFASHFNYTSPLIMDSVDKLVQELAQGHRRPMTQPTALNCSHCIMCNCRQTWSTYRNFHTPSLILYQFSSLLLLSVQREELKENSYQGYVIQNEAKSCCSFCEVFTHLPGDQFSLGDQFSSIKASLKSGWTTVRGKLSDALLVTRWK